LDEPVRIPQRNSFSSRNTTPGHNHRNSDLAAPPAALALVATVLTAFPNPPISAVVPSGSLISAAVEGGDDKIAIKDLKRVPEGKALLSAALETTVNSQRRKRTASTIEVPAAPLTENPEMIAAASAWANLPASGNNEETKGEEVDRHVKIRFVERLTSVIAETEAEGSVKGAHLGKLTHSHLQFLSLVLHTNECYVIGMQALLTTLILARKMIVSLMLC